MKRILFSLLLLMLALGGTAAAEDSFVDGTGTEVAYGQDCQRIVSLMPNVTEIVAFLGYADKLVGKSVFCNYPDSVLHADDIGGQIDASLEKIVALQPDIVLAYQGNSLELVSQIRQLGIPVCALKEANNLLDIAEQMRVIDRVLATSDYDGSPEIDNWTAELDAVLESIQTTARPSVFFGYPGELVYTAGTDSFISNVIESCGAVNAVDIPDRWPSVSAEYILAIDPDWILTTTSCTEAEDPADTRQSMIRELRADPVWRELRAVREGHLIVVNSDHLLRPGPRILLGIQELLSQLGHPVPDEVSSHGAAAAQR